MTTSASARCGADPASPPSPTVYPAGIDWAMPLPARPLGSLLDEAVARHGPRPCVDFLGRRYTYAEIGGLVARAATGLRRLGIGKGDRVALLLPNCPYYVVAFHAVLKIGATVVPCNPLHVPRELAQQIDDSGARIVVTLDLRALYDTAAELLRTTKLERVVVCRMARALPPIKAMLFPILRHADIAAIPEDHRHMRFERLIETLGPVEAEPIDPVTDVAVLQYTGGTTGTPKAAMLTHANLFANALQIKAWFPGIADGGERVLGVLPFFHVFGMAVGFNLAVAAGAEMILLPRFELKQVLDAIGRARPTLFPGVPTIYRAIASAPDVASRDLSSIKYCISGGAPLPLAVKQDFEALTGCVLVEGYGLTEASPVVACNPLAGGGKDGSVGLPLPGTRIELRDLDDPTRPAAPGAKGEICVGGPQVMAAYWQRPDETAGCMIDGLLRTGDVGTMDDDGYLFLVDRIKDVILCSGYNVYPRDVETAIYRHPAVQAATVIGVHDAYRGQAPKAFVQLREGHSLTADALRDFLGEHLSRIEMPRDVEFRADLPKTLIGKLSKKELVAEEAARALRQQRET